MISDNMIKKLNYQINREIYSGYFYLGMAYYAASIGLKGFANWFHCQAKEEYEHAGKIADYVTQQGARVMLGAIEEPPQDFSSGPGLFQRTLEHEEKVTGLINGLVVVAKSEGDKDTEQFLQWFVKEQIEEEATPTRILGKIKTLGAEGLSKIDAQLSARK
ncbi:MAG: ferritin [Candidatus Omnitrophica bacterium]|nr:ferritin [Candidatus Omnitrophota bacterium]